MEKINRDTNADLMNKVFDLVQKDDCFEKARTVIDRFMPESIEVMELSDCKFDFQTKLRFCGSNGTFLDFGIEGVFREDNVDKVIEQFPCGTFKISRCDLDALKIIGEFAASLIYYARGYVRQEIKRYTPTRKPEKQQECEEDVSAEKRNIVFCYVYDNSEKYSGPVIISDEPENIANFVMANGIANKIIITDELDRLLVRTFGEFIDVCPDQKLFGPLKEALVPMQMGMKLPGAVRYWKE